MCPINLLSYSNKSLQLRMNSGQLLYGAIVLSRNPKTIKTNGYVFIPAIDLIEYEKAKKKNDTKRMQELELEIDVTAIESYQIIL
jgi:hypothetical protein